jgi:glycosyltransferase involved in cell wall biosynthesis
VAALAGPLPVSVATDISPAGRNVILRALADRPDLVVIDFPHAAVLAPWPLGVPSVLFTHNVETEIFERHARVAKGLWRHVWRNQAAKMERFERETCQAFTSVVAVSGRDAAALERRFALPAVETIDTGVDLDFFRFTAPADSPPVPEGGGTVVFTGALDSPANIDGIAFLMSEVWPLIAQARPAVRFAIVGRNPAASLLARARQQRLPFSFTGFVDDIRPHVSGAHVSVIPLRVGSGTRIKAFEAMAMGLPVVSTSIGIEGLGLEPGRHFLPADDAPAFAAAILRLLDDAALRGRIAAAARARLEKRYSWAQVTAKFEAICLAALQRSALASSPGAIPAPQNERTQYA